MSRTTNGINKITGMVIGISLRLLACVLVAFLLWKGVVWGFAFGHAIFYATSVEAPPGREITVAIKDGASITETARLLKSDGLIGNEYSFVIQAHFFDYKIHPGTYELNTSMTSREVLEEINDNAGKDEKETKNDRK